ERRPRAGAAGTFAAGNSGTGQTGSERGCAEAAMAVTRSWTAAGAAPKVVSVEKPRASRGQMVWLVGASFFAAAGLAMVYAAKIPNFPPAEHVLNINRVQSPEELLPILESFPAPERQGIAEKTFEAIERGRPLPNVGSLSRILPLRKLKPLMVV